MKFQSREARYMGKAFIEREENGSVLKSEGCGEGVNSRQDHAVRTRKPDGARCIPVSLETLWFKQIPKAKVTFDVLDVPAKSLEHLRNNGSAQGQRFRCGNQSPKFTVARAGSLAKEISPDRAIHEDQTRSLLNVLRFPFHIPLPK